MKHIAGFLFAFFFIIGSFAQMKKSVEAIRIFTPLTIDGVLEEEVYKQAIPAKDFVQIQPFNGKPAMQPTEVWFFLRRIGNLRRSHDV